MGLYRSLFRTCVLGMGLLNMLLGCLLHLHTSNLSALILFYRICFKSFFPLMVCSDTYGSGLTDHAFRSPWGADAQTGHRWSRTLDGPPAAGGALLAGPPGAALAGVRGGPRAPYVLLTSLLRFDQLDQTDQLDQLDHLDHATSYM